MTPLTGSDTEVARTVVDAHHALEAAGLNDLIWGHLAVRDPEGRGVWTKAAGWGMGEVTPERVLLVSPGGEVLAGRGRRHIEVPIHLELMRARPDIAATVHSHAPSVAAFASLDVPLRAISHDATPFLVPDGTGTPDVPRFTGTANLIRTTQLGAALADRLGDGNGCLIPGHGLVAVGETVAAAVLHAVLLERACATQLAALAAGGPRRWSGDDEIDAKRTELWPPSAAGAAFAHLVRRARPFPTETE